jgi:hypothetical protein
VFSSLGIINRGRKFVCPVIVCVGLVHAEIYTVHAEIYTVHAEIYTVRAEIYTVHAEIYMVHAEIYTVHAEIWWLIVNLMINYGLSLALAKPNNNFSKIL